MRKHRRHRRLWALASLAPAAASAYWLISGGCTTGQPGGQTGNQFAVSNAECRQTDQRGDDFEVKLSAVSAQGRQLSYTRRVTTNPDGDGSFVVETEILADGQLVMRVTAQSGPGGVEVDTDYGPLVPGLNAASVMVQNGQVTGNVNGRALVPMAAEGADPAAATFADGAPPPEDGMDPDLEAAVTELLNAARNSAGDCQAQANPTSKPAMASLLQHRDVDTGHDSDPESSAACIGCWAGCSTGAVACVAGVSAGCTASLIFYAVCEAIGVAACGVAYLACVGGCNATGAPCCPVACGDVACCASDETCLNAEIGLCCSPGRTPCVGEECCTSTQVCMDTGPNAGTCCEPENICGNTCCEPTDSCIADISLCCPAGNVPCDDKCCPSGQICLGNGLCCDPDLACGSACCDSLDSTCIPAQSLCCGFSTVACGNTCCEIGEGCFNGTTCCPQERLCATECCPEGSGCDPQTNQCTPCPNPGEKFCLESSSCCPENKVCTPVAGVCCNAGQLYCDGACRNFSECIQ